jgi:hypothetical protein
MLRSNSVGESLGDVHAMLMNFAAMDTPDLMNGDLRGLFSPHR